MHIILVKIFESLNPPRIQSNLIFLFFNKLRASGIVICNKCDEIIESVN